MENMTSMRHIGMNREDMKKGVLSKLGIGQQYSLKSIHKDPEGNGNITKCKLVELSTHVAVFQHKNGTNESFTYPELWRQMMAGEFK